MLGAVLVQVVGRYFAFSIDWAAESATLAQVWMVLLAAGLAMRDELHVRVDALLNALPPRLVRAAYPVYHPGLPVVSVSDDSRQPGDDRSGLHADLAGAAPAHVDRLSFRAPGTRLFRPGTRADSSRRSATPPAESPNPGEEAVDP
jgi:hypothetical protein